MSAIIDIANEVFTAADNAAWDPATITVEGWVKLRSDPADYSYLVSHGDAWSMLATSSATNNPGTNWRNTGETNHAITGNSVLSTDVWYHIPFVIDGTDLKLYVNGSSDKTQTSITVTTKNSTDELQVGSSGADPAVGDIKVSDVRIWSTARTAGEIAANYNKRLTGTETGLVGYWKFDEGTGNTAQDSTSNNRDLTAVAGNWDSADDPTFVASNTGTGFFFMSV